MAKKKPSETITENIFRKEYGAGTFIEKSAIPSGYGFTSKKGTSYKGYPDFFYDDGDCCIVVEAKASEQVDAEKETQFYMINNKIRKDILGIAVSGQTKSALRVTYYLKTLSENKIIKLKEKDTLISLKELDKIYLKSKYGKKVSTEHLIKVLNQLNKTFNADSKIRDTDRSLFFSGIMIALKNNNFRSTYRNIQAPSKEDASSTKVTVLESHYLNSAILDAISKELESKVNNLSKEFSWRDKFSFIKNVDYSLAEYKEIIRKIECEIFYPFQNEEKQDILGRAYKIFLSRAGKVDNKNIILTPDHIKALMVKLARLDVKDVVLDTCTGSGGFLMESMETLIDLAAEDVKAIKHIKEKQLIGFEIDSVLFALACSNMFLHGDGRTNLLYRNSLLDQNQGGIVNSDDKALMRYIRKLKPNKVIINPPYENNKPILFVKQAIEYLEPNGKLVVIMPTPTLTRNQNGITEEILKKAKLDYVIKMPTKLFSEQKRTVNTSIFGFTKTAQKQSDDVLFYDLEDDGFVSVQHKGRIDKNDGWDKLEDKILDLVLNSKEELGVCQKKKIYDKGVLNCAGVQKKKSSSYKMLRVDELFEVELGTLASEKSIDGVYPFITAGEEWKTHNDFEKDCEAIVYAISASGSLGRSHYINGKFVASNLCLVLTPKDQKKYPVNMEFYNCYFASCRKQIVSDLADGTSKLTIDANSFKKYYIDYVPYTDQLKFVNTKLNAFRKTENAYLAAKKQIEHEIEKLI